MPSKKTHQQEPLYVSIDNPQSIRKDLLESAIMVVELLEKYEYAKGIREAKLEKINDASKLLRKLSLSIKELENKLPQNIPHIKKRKKPVEEKPPEQQPQEKPKQTPQPKKIQPRPNPELKNLEHELSDIRKRLENLNI